MKKGTLTGAIFCGLVWAVTGANAQTLIAECPKGQKPAQINVQATVSTNLTGCPLLEEKDFRKLVDQYLVGTVFAYPAVPNTCLSGTIVGGSIVTAKKTYEVTGRTESAQRFFAEAGAIDPSGGGLFLSGVSQSGIPFASGAAATIVSMQGVNRPLDLQLVLSDRFSLNFNTFPITDTEDFEIVGAKGGSASGRLTGIANVFQFPPNAIADAEFTVQGEICLK